jgi:carbon-monoxide dehydrogenase large subunit
MTRPGARLKDRRLITGRGTYADDWRLDRQAYGAFLCADLAHAAIRGIDASAALARPGVLAVFTGADMAAAGMISLPTLMPVPGRDGQAMRTPPRPVLARERVRHVGEALALVVAETRAAAEDAALAVAVDLEPLPAVADARGALEAGAPRLHAEAPGNLVFDFAAGDAAPVAAAFAGAARVVRLALAIPRVVGNPMEPRASLAAWDEASETWTLHACIQGAFHMRTQLAQVLGVPVERVRVIAADVGGSFGVHSNAYPEDVALMVAARRLGRPIRWTATRGESFVSDEQGRGVECVAELALDGDGRSSPCASISSPTWAPTCRPSGRSPTP